MTDTVEMGTSSDEVPAYVDTPYGMVTASGRWYHIREEDLLTYAGDVFDHVSLEQLVRWADCWIDSPRTVALWSLPVLMWGLPVTWAVVATLAVYCGWALVSPAIPSTRVAWVVSGLSSPLVQGAYYAAALSLFAMGERFAVVGIGLLAFVLFRWGLVGWVARLGLRPVQRWLYPLPITDQVLRALILRAALRYRVSVTQVDALTAEILENWGTRTQTSDDSSRSVDES